MHLIIIIIIIIAYIRILISSTYAVTKITNTATEFHDYFKTSYVTERIYWFLFSLCFSYWSWHSFRFIYILAVRISSLHFFGTYWYFHLSYNVWNRVQRKVVLDYFSNRIFYFRFSSFPIALLGLCSCHSFKNWTFLKRKCFEKVICLMQIRFVFVNRNSSIWVSDEISLFLLSMLRSRRRSDCVRNEIITGVAVWLKKKLSTKWLLVSLGFSKEFLHCQKIYWSNFMCFCVSPNCVY